jgi:hypothetical protein
LDSPVILQPGQTFAVIETVRNADGTYIMPIEYGFGDYHFKGVDGTR